MTPDDRRGLDDHQYTVAGLDEYEAIYGIDFVSPGGRSMTAEILDGIDWGRSRRVLDVGSGLGGAAFMLARDFDASVTGIDASMNMTIEATRRCDSYGLRSQVTFVHGDVVTAELAPGFDIVHSREVFLHIHDKAALFDELLRLLVPGGALVFTDYCRGPGPPSGSFDAYVAEFGYDLRTIDEISTLLDAAGFLDVGAVDRTERFIELHHEEISGLSATDLSFDQQAHMAEGWQAKIERAEAGEQRWGWFTATARATSATYRR